MRLFFPILATALMASSTAWAAPPAIRPLDVPTIYAFQELAHQLDLEASPQPQRTTKLRRIVIDPGHGGSNQGAVGVANIHEKYITLDLAYEVRDALRAKYPGVEVLLTRYWDRPVGLQERTMWANQIGADLFISLHYNAATHDRAVGYETYFLDDATMLDTTKPAVRRRSAMSKQQKRAAKLCDRARVKAHVAAREVLVPPHQESKRLAAAVQAHLIAALPSVNRGVKQANFAVLRGAKMPAVVVESGFLTHPVEGVDVLKRPHRDAVVEALVSAVGDFDAGLPDPTPEDARSVAEHLVVKARSVAVASQPLQSARAQNANIVDAVLAP